MKIHWIDAHRKLNAGIPITGDEEWARIDRSLNWFYWGHAAVFIMLVAIFVVFLGIPHSQKNEAEFVQRCEMRGGHIERGMMIECVGENDVKTK